MPKMYIDATIRCKDPKSGNDYENVASVLVDAANQADGIKEVEAMKPEDINPDAVEILSVAFCMDAPEG